MALLEEEIIERTAALVESLHALSGVLALALASTPRGEISACKIDALTDLSYKIHLNLSELEEIRTQMSARANRECN